MPEIYDVVILGSGPAGLTAAIYTGRALLKTLVIAGSGAGGQLMLTSEVENFPGFSNAILGPELMEEMRKQAGRFGVEYVNDDATGVNFSSHPLKVYVGERLYLARSAIIASGASAKWLALESETRLRGRGVSSCATCDGYFFRGKELVVVGGGDTAMEEALFLTKFATKVSVIHRRDKLRASKILQDRAFKNEKIRFLWGSVVEEILGAEKVEGVRVKNLKSGDTSIIPCAGVFMAIGYQPNTDLFAGQLKMDEKGYIIAHEGVRTSVPGVFAAGDVHDYKYRQAVTAAGDGCIAALEAERYLEEIKTKTEAVLKPSA